MAQYKDAGLVPFKCAQCGSSKFVLPGNPQRDSVVTCGQCGVARRYGAIQSSALKQTKAGVEKAFKDAFNDASKKFK